MNILYTQLAGCVVLVICSITLGILLKKYHSKSLAVKITAIIYIVFFCAYFIPLLYAFGPDYTHYDLMIGIPSSGFQTPFKIVGTVLSLLGTFFIFVSFYALAISGRGLPAVFLSQKLATEGIYAFTRNPMSLGFYILVVAGGLLKGSIFFILWSLIVIIPTHICFLRFFEERELELRIGQPYIDYKKRVPFLIPNFRNISKLETRNSDG